MSFYNEGVTSKLNSFFHNFQVKSPRYVVFKNVVTEHTFSKDEGSYYSFYPKERLFLFKEGKRMSRSEQKEFSDSYKLQVYMLQKLGKTSYDDFHGQTSLCFRDYLHKPELLDYRKEEIKEWFQEYKKRNSKKQNHLRFGYLSNEQDSIDVINELCRTYEVRKDGHVFTVKADPSFKQTLRTLLSSKSHGSTKYVVS